MASQDYTESVPETQLNYHQESNYFDADVMKVMIATDIHLGKKNNV